jgi:hypothetical protein
MKDGASRETLKILDLSVFRAFYTSHRMHLLGRFPTLKGAGKVQPHLSLFSFQQGVKTLEGALPVRT